MVHVSVNWKTDSDGHIRVYELWKNLGTMKNEGVLKGFKMNNALLTSAHFDIIQAVYLDREVRAFEFPQGFSVSGNKQVTELNWDISDVETLHGSNAKPPLWLALQLIPGLSTLDLDRNNYEGNASAILLAVCRSNSLKYLSLRNAFKNLTVLPTCMWQMTTLSHIALGDLVHVIKNSTSTRSPLFKGSILLPWFK